MDSYTLYKAGNTIAQIATARNLTTSTIEGHLAYYVYNGAINVTELVSDEKKHFIQDVVETYGAEKLGPLKEVLGDNYSYGEIRATIAWMRKEGVI